MPQACPAEFHAFHYTTERKSPSSRRLAVAASGGDGEPPGGFFRASLCSEKRNDPRGKPAAFRETGLESATSKRVGEDIPRLRFALMKAARNQGKICHGTFRQSRGEETDYGQS